MMARRRYLLAYDIGSPSRSRRVLKLVRAQSVGWQKSVYECVLSSLERLRLLEQVAAILDEKEDAFLLLPLQAEARSDPWGLAAPLVTPDCYFMG